MWLRKVLFFFKEIYPELVGNNIVDIVHSYLVFFIWINSEEYENLFAPVTMEEM